MAKGSITRLEQVPRKRCRKWKLRYRKDGRDRTRRFSGTYSQAQAALEEFVAEVDSESATKVGGDATFDEYAVAWAERRRAAGEIEESTYRAYRVSIARARPYIGSSPVSKLTRQDVAALVAGLMSGAKGRKASAGTAAVTLTTVSQVLGEAVLDGLIPANPAATVRGPKRGEKRRRAIGVDAVASIAAQVSAEPPTAYGAALMMALFLGLRRGEICGMQWRDIEGGFARVSRSLSATTGEVKPPKTRSGVRKVPVPSALEGYLDRWRDTQRSLIEAAGGRQGRETHIVANSDLGPLSGNAFYAWWVRNRERYGASCSVHELRHTYLTALANSGASVQAIKSIAGWSNLAMADVYVHDDDAANAEAVEMLESRLVACAAGTRGTHPQSGI